MFSDFIICYSLFPNSPTVFVRSFTCWRGQILCMQTKIPHFIERVDKSNHLILWSSSNKYNGIPVDFGDGLNLSGRDRQQFGQIYYDKQLDLDNSKLLDKNNPVVIR